MFKLRYVQIWRLVTKFAILCSRARVLTVLRGQLTKGCFTGIDATSKLVQLLLSAFITQDDRWFDQNMARVDLGYGDSL